MIDEEEELMDIKALHRQGLTYAEIGPVVGRDWRTVKRYLTEGAQPVYRRQKRPSKLDPFNDIIEGWLQRSLVFERLPFTRISLATTASRTTTKPCVATWSKSSWRSFPLWPKSASRLLRVIRLKWTGPMRSRS